MGKTANPEPSTPEHAEPTSASASLTALVRLLARHAAQDAFASVQPAFASETDCPEPEDAREAEA